MRQLHRIILALTLLALIGLVANAQSPGPLLLENPTVSANQIAFAHAGDIWVVGRSGGDARRLTTNPAQEAFPVFSPDGSKITFARYNVAGGPLSWDVYVMPVSGGEEQRVTFHPDLDFPVNWTPDGKNVLIQSFRHRTSPLGGRLYTVPTAGGFPTEVSVPRGWEGSFSPAGDHIAYTPLINPGVVGWRNYRGGATSRIWLVKLSDANTEAIPHANFNDINPMWVGTKVFFVSDRSGAENLFVYDTITKKINQLTQFEKYGIKSASANGDTIVFNRDGSIHLFDVNTNQTRKIEVRVSGDFPELKPRRVDPVQWQDSAGVSPDGSYLLLGVRGEVLTANTGNGDVTNITQTGAAAERNPAWSPDGKWIAYFSDESGELELYLKAAPGSSTPTVTRRITIEKKSGLYNELQWSPDSTMLVFSDSHLALWCYDLERNSARRIDAAKHSDGDFAVQPSWSPDSRWLAYSKLGFNRSRSVTLYSFATGQTSTITSPAINAQSPLFDNNGKYLYFLGGNRTGLVESQAMSGFPFRSQVTRNLYAVVLNQTDSSPLRIDLTSAAAKASRVVIDLENIDERIVSLPFWPPNGGRILAGKAGTIFIVEGGTLHKFVSGKPGLEKFVEGAGNYRITADGARLAYRRQGIWSVVSTDVPPKPEDGRIKLNPIELIIDPRAEWSQMFQEAWRRMREDFYDPNLHGQNLPELQAHYAAYLPGVSSREDLNILFKEMFSNLSVSHLYIAGGEVAVPRGEVNENVGLLGADFEIDNGRYRIKRILRGDGPRGLSSPLLQPGVNVRAGDYLLAVDGEEIKASENLYRHFLNKANKVVQVKIASTVDGRAARTVSIVPILSEVQLRNYDWVEDNRRRVSDRSGGKLGYIYLPDTGNAGYNAFNWDFYAQLDKQGLIVDGRFNQGGRAADYIIDILRRVPLQRAKLRAAEDVRIPTGIIAGPKVLLTNEMAGSGGDTLPWMWQQTKIGPVVGTRTGGAGVGATIHQLLDGGTFQVPDWGWYDSQTGHWLVENRGVTPDYQVDILPADWRAGRDPQLERAVQLAMDALKKFKPKPIRRPTAPVFK